MKSKKVKIIVASVLAFVIFVCSLSFILAWSGILSHKIDNDGTVFRILQLTDVHIQENHEDDWAFDTIDKVIGKSNPDLIAVTGDITSGRYKDQDFNAGCIKKFAEKIETYKIPWTFTFGNHDAESTGDAEGKWRREQIADYLTSDELQYCIFEEGEIFAPIHEKQQKSIGNSYINITADGKMVNMAGQVIGADGNLVYDQQVGKQIMSLFFLDSNDYEYDENGNGNGYGIFRPDQIEWYKRSVLTMQQQNNGTMLPSLAFFHIPMQEYVNAWEDGKRLYGYKWEKGGMPKVSDNMFETMVELGSTKATFAGHDHMCAFAAEYKGIKLVYGYSGDHGIYAVPQNGGTIINVKADGNFTLQGIYRNSGVGVPIISKAY